MLLISLFIRIEKNLWLNQLQNEINICHIKIMLMWFISILWTLKYLLIIKKLSNLSKYFNTIKPKFLEKLSINLQCLKENQSLI